jgi:acetylornithine deacetylase
VRTEEVALGRSNVIARFGSGGRTLLFNGHLDTLPVASDLPRPFDGRLEDGFVYGAGINNMKGAVAAMVAAMSAIVRRGVVGQIVLAAVIGECDALGLGTWAALKNGLSADACLNGEPTELRILTDNAGVSQLDITIHGREVHVYEREKGLNAIEQARRLLDKLDASIFQSDGGLDRLPIVNVGTVSGGSWPSLTAAQCTFGIDVRSTGSMTPESILTDVQTMLDEAATEDPAFTATASLRGAPMFIQQRPYHIDATAELVRHVADAHAALHGAPPEIGPHWPESYYGTDASHILHAGIPTVIYGPGSHAQISRPNERVALEELRQAAATYATAACRFLEAR